MLSEERIDGSADKVDAALAAIEKTIQALNSMGLFSEARVVWLENATFLGDNRAANSQSVKDAIQRLSDKVKAGLSEDVTLIITAGTVDKRRTFFKTCKAHGHVETFDIPDERSSTGQTEATARLNLFLKQTGLTMETPARLAFQQKVGQESRIMLNELNKLSVALGDRSEATTDDVLNFVSASREAVFWDLADAFSQRDLPGALRLLRQLVFQRQNLIGLVSNLERRIRDLLVLREAIDQQWLIPKRQYGKPGFAWATLPPEADHLFANEMENDPRKMHPYRVSLLGVQASGFTTRRLQYCLQQVTQAHEKMVSARVPAELVMEILLIRMLSTPKRQARRMASPV